MQVARATLGASSCELHTEALQQEYAEANHERREQIRWWLRKNSCAIRHVKECTRVAGGTKFTYLALAFELPFAAMVTQPMRLSPIMAWTRFKDDITRQHLRRLQDVGEIAAHRVGWGRYQFEFLAMGGPLGLRADIDTRKIGQSDCRKIRESTAERFGTLPCAVQGTRAVQDLCTYVDLDQVVVPPPKAPPPPAPPNETELLVQQVVEWWPTECPSMPGGHPAKSRIDTPHEFDILRQLLREHPLDDVRARARAMWRVRETSHARSDATWVARSDRSLHVLRSKWNFLGSLLVPAVGSSSRVEETQKRLRQREQWEQEIAHERTGS